MQLQGDCSPAGLQLPWCVGAVVVALLWVMGCQLAAAVVLMWLCGCSAKPYAALGLAS
jgi:hypothetical protein